MQLLYTVSTTRHRLVLNGGFQVCIIRWNFENEIEGFAIVKDHINLNPEIDLHGWDHFRLDYKPQDKNAFPCNECGTWTYSINDFRLCSACELKHASRWKDKTAQACRECGIFGDT